LKAIVAAMDFDQQVQLIKNADNLKFEIQTQEQNQSRVIGKHGKNINALQTIIQEYAYYLDFREEPILLDCGGYRKRRQEALIALSTFKAEQVQATHKPTYLDPMPALERKIIYENLAANNQVIVRTQGRGLDRYLVIKPA
ncbi:KH domain-containing protein, partial [Lactobacillus sp. XV13L]|nr:KH domain-containing protein [Lactobacillus sp. XV13L]